jgi:hypothetical protein
MTQLIALLAIFLAAAALNLATGTGSGVETMEGYNSSTFGSRKLQTSSKYCDESTSSNPLYKRYIDGMNMIYPGSTGDGTCWPIHKKCGWPVVRPESSKKLPLYVLSVGLEGAGHHLWTELLEQPVFNCIWKNGRHYRRDISDGVPRTTAETLNQGFQEQFKLRKEGGKSPCTTIYDSEDSFPTGAIRQSGRVFMRPDLINLQQLDGVVFNVKYLIIVRNTTVR